MQMPSIMEMVLKNSLKLFNLFLSSVLIDGMDR
jgi:hypothetical protein